MMLRSIKKTSRNKGLTILEAMVTMAALAAGISAVAAFTNFVSAWSASNRIKFQAASLAERVIEEARSYGCDPNDVAAPCSRLLTWPTAEENVPAFPRLYCLPAAGEPQLMAEDADRCDGYIFQASIMVATADNVSENSVIAAVHAVPNYVDFARRRLSNGSIPAANNVTLNSVANIRVSIRWNDVLPGNAIDATKTPKFFAYQTRVTQ